MCIWRVGGTVTADQGSNTVQYNYLYICLFSLNTCSPQYISIIFPAALTSQTSCHGQPVPSTQASCHGKPVPSTQASRPGEPVPSTQASCPGEPVPSTQASCPGEPVSSTQSSRPGEPVPSTQVSCLATLLSNLFAFKSNYQSLATIGPMIILSDG